MTAWCLELEGNHVFSKLVKATSRQVTSIAAGPGGKLFLAAANPGKVFTLGPENESEGTYESQPFDAHIFSRWGRTVWWGENFAAANNGGASRIAVYARSGNTSDPDSNWSDWSGPYANPSGDKLDCPAARFVQWKAVLRGGGAGGNATPAIDWFSIAYLPKNIPPEVTAIAVQDPGVRVQGISMPTAGPGPQTPAQIRMPQPPPSASSANGAFSITSISALGQSSDSAHFDPVPQGFSQKGYESVLWTADDANGDQLEFSIYFRGENESSWKLLKDKLDTRFLYLGHNVDARRRLLPEDCRQRLSVQPRRRRAFFRTRIRPFCRGQCAAVHRSTFGGFRQRRRARAISGQRAGELHCARAI